LQSVGGRPGPGQGEGRTQQESAQTDPGGGGVVTGRPGWREKVLQKCEGVCVCAPCK